MRAAPGLGQQRHQRVPRVVNRGFRIGPSPTAPTPVQLGRGTPDAALVLFYDVRHMDYAGP
jgi:hypothetical protein